MNKITTAIISASVGLVIGMTGVAGASATPGLGSAKPKYTQSQMNRCAGAVMAADEIISGGDKSSYAKKQFQKKRNECAKVVNGF